jgi:hypothetical protein
MLGFQSVAELAGQKALVDEDGKVILRFAPAPGRAAAVTKASTSSWSKRSALVETSPSGVTLEDYYTTEIPGTSSFPKDGSDRI